MKNLIVLLLVSTALFSCKKETFEPNSANKTLAEKSFGTSKIECIYFFTETTSTSGHVDLFSGQNLNYVYNFTSADLRDTLFMGEQPARYIKFTRYVSNSEIRQNNGNFFVNIYLEDTVEVIFNKNYANNEMTLNGNELLPEPSNKMAENTDFMLNYFKVKIINNTVDAERLTKKL